MSAQLIFDTAPLGSLIRFSNGEPRPPARFSRKLRAWNNDNGLGRLVERSPARTSGSGTVSPASFVLHLGNFDSQGIILVTIRRHYSLNSKLQFEVMEVPRAGMVRVLTHYADRDELRHLADDMAAAELWMAQNRYSDMRTEVVVDESLVCALCTAEAA